MKHLVLASFAGLLSIPTSAEPVPQFICEGESAAGNSYTLTLERQGHDLLAKLLREQEQLFLGKLKAFREALYVDENGRKYTKTWYWDPVTDLVRVILIDEKLSAASLETPEKVEQMKCERTSQFRL